ncbi:IS481 family transposase [Clostridia bacterium]|nr:IS481 family transposase [Clostridia bacterium]
MKGVKFTAKQKLKALEMYHSGKRDYQVAAHFHCTIQSLYRWQRQYDGTLESLENRSSRPHTPHPNSHTQEEREAIIKLYEANPNIGYSELYGELRSNFAYKRHFMSMYNFIRKNAIRPAETKIYEKYEAQTYDTPPMLGIKWQMDVKYVPKECYPFKDETHALFGEKFYQYTMIDEATRERFIFPYREQSGYSTQDFIKRAVLYFGYIPAIIQTDNGTEFTNPKGANATDKIHFADKVMNQLKIYHQLIRAYTPRHNGKVERSHRTDQERFYNFLTFTSFDELKEKMGAWLNRYNRTPSSALKNRIGKHVWQSPLEKRAELLEILKEEQGKPDVPKIRFIRRAA